MLEKFKQYVERTKLMINLQKAKMMAIKNKETVQRMCGRERTEMVKKWK